MKKIVAVCGNGLGSSLMVEMNIKNLLNEESITGYEVSHSDITSFDPKNIDILVVGEDLNDATKAFKGIKILLQNVISKNELKAKLLSKIK